jgi:hypothetical protein
MFRVMEVAPVLLQKDLDSQKNNIRWGPQNISLLDKQHVVQCAPYSTTNGADMAGPRTILQKLLVFCVNSPLTFKFFLTLRILFCIGVLGLSESSLIQI